MLATDPITAVEASLPWGTRLRALHELAKPNLTFLVILTGVFGFYLGSEGFLHLDWLRFAGFVVGTAMSAGGACALNMVIEREVDGRMRRTARRPLPSGRVQPWQAWAFAVVNVVVGVGILYELCGPIPAGLSLATTAIYAFVYTPLKSAHGPLAVVVGAVPGAIPPVMGWAAARGTVGLEGLALFSIVFAWQFPHFLALAYMYREDYARGGFDFVPGSPRGVGVVIALGTLGVVLASLAPAWLGLAGWFYVVGAVSVGGAFLAVALRAMRSLDTKNARGVFLGSITYLPALLGLLVVDKFLQF